MSVDIDLVVGKSDDGKWIRERIPARVLGNDVYELAHSPMFVKGLAADDRVRLTKDGQHELVERGNNVSVQVFGEWGEVDALAQHVASLRGRLCGKEPNARVFTIPRSASLYLIETTIDGALASWPNLSWIFGNVTTLQLTTGVEENGSPTTEEVQAFAHPDGSFELAASPMLVEGIAAGDKFEIADDGRPEITTAAGMTAVQTFGDWDLTFFEPTVIELGGWLDGRAGDAAAVFTFPASTERASIESLFAEAQANADGRSWRVANS